MVSFKVGKKMERKERLSELRNDIYNAEDIIDGAYDSKDVEFSDLTEINERYDKLLKDMTKLVKLLGKVV
tara:strand:+ start:328 stop:537 length:210 start_codon:yes stop_codon:yes gene_type:complete